MMIGRPAVDPATGVYVQPPSQAWQSVWQTGADDGSYAAAGGSGGQHNVDGQRYRFILLMCLEGDEFLF
jgi:nuclear transcription factor Y gamma